MSKIIKFLQHVSFFFQLLPAVIIRTKNSQLDAVPSIDEGAFVDAIHFSLNHRIIIYNYIECYILLKENI